MNLDLTKIILEYLDKYKLVGMLIILIIVFHTTGFLGINIVDLDSTTKIIVVGFGIITTIISILYYMINSFLIKVDSKMDFNEANAENTKFLKLTIETQESIMEKISDNINDIFNLLIDINAVINGIPNRHLIKKLIETRTQALSSDIIKNNHFFLFSDQEISKKIYQNQIDYIKKNNEFIFETYINDIKKLSNNTLTDGFKDKLQESIDEFIQEIDDILINQIEKEETKIISIFEKLDNFKIQVLLIYELENNENTFMVNH